MRIFYLSEIGTIIFDILVWICFHLGIGYRYSQLPIERFDPRDRKYLPRKWEKNGEIYQRLFKVKAWKSIIPSGAKMYKGAFEVKRLPKVTPAYLKLWIKESCRAESCHWVMMLPGGLFFLWNTVEVGWWMVIYAVLNNLVPIIMQRYNRPRIQKLLAKVEKKQQEPLPIQVHFEPQKEYSHIYQ